MPLLLVAALVAIALAGYLLKRPAQATLVQCAHPAAGCTFSRGGARVTVKFSATPTPLQAFELAVQAPAARRISAEFQMVGMDMGFNRYDLHRNSDGVWTSRVTLPVCVSGQREWTLYLDLDGSRYALPFKTQ